MPLPGLDRKDKPVRVAQSGSKGVSGSSPVCGSKIGKCFVCESGQCTKPRNAQNACPGQLTPSDTPPSLTMYVQVHAFYVSCCKTCGVLCIQSCV